MGSLAYGNPSVLVALAKALGDDDRFVRRAAIGAVCEVIDVGPSQEVVLALDARRNDVDTYVRDAAVKTLAQVLVRNAANVSVAALKKANSPMPRGYAS